MHVLMAVSRPAIAARLVSEQDDYGQRTGAPIGDVNLGWGARAPYRFLPADTVSSNTK